MSAYSRQRFETPQRSASSKTLGIDNTELQKDSNLKKGIRSFLAAIVALAMGLRGNALPKGKAVTAWSNFTCQV